MTDIPTNRHNEYILRFGGIITGGFLCLVNTSTMEQVLIDSFCDRHFEFEMNSMRSYSAKKELWSLESQVV